MGGRAIGGRAGCALALPCFAGASFAEAASPAGAAPPSLASAAGAAPPSVASAAGAAPPSAFASAFAPSPFASAFAPPFGFAPSAFALAPSAFAAAFFGFAGAFVAVAPLPNAFAASASSTLEAGAVTPRPAFWRISRASFEVIPRSLAISWTRFFAIR